MLIPKRIRKQNQSDEGIVDVGGENSLGISTRKSSPLDLITMGFYPKPTYTQLGTYRGKDSIYFKRGDKVRITYRTPKTIIEKYTTLWSNIERVEKIP